MKKLAIGVGIVTLLILGFIGLGALQPVGHVAASRAAYSQSPETVWAAISDFQRWPEWNSAADRMQRATDREGKPVWVMVGEWGEMPSIVDVWEPPSRMVTRIPEDAGLGFGGSWTYEIETAPGGATVQITERGEVESPIFRAIMLLTGQHGTLEQFLRDLGKKFGETVEPQRVDAPADN